MRLRTINRHQAPAMPGQPQQPQPQQQVPGQQAFPQQPTTVVQEPVRSFAPPPPPGQQITPQPGQQIPGQGPAPLGMDAVFPNDPSIPPELRGRPVRDAMDAYNTMRQDFLQRNGIRPQQPQAPQQPQQPQAGQRTAPQNGAAQNPRDSFFRDPDGAIDARLQAFESRLLDRLGPVIQQTQQSGIERALQQVRAEFPDFVRYEGQIIGQLKSAPPELLANPESYRAAYRYVLGDEALRQRQAPQQGQPRQPQWVPAPQAQPLQPAQSFFTEAPTPNASAPNASGITPQVVEMARRFRIPPEEYLAWSGGNVPPQGGNSNGR